MSAMSNDAAAANHQITLLSPASSVTAPREPAYPERSSWPQYAAEGRDEIIPRFNLVIIKNRN
eukprot:1528746-Rhodomonas_salina.3